MAEMISPYLELTEEEAEIINKNIPIKHFKKGTVLLKAGDIAIECYFNLKGCVREYYLTEEGEERTTQFFTEEDSIAALTSYVNQTPADQYFECVEDCTLSVLNYYKERALYEIIPEFERLCRVSIEDDFGKHQKKLAKFITSSPKERYLDLLENRPDLLNRVPQYHLASYLGVTPESLSRIRKRVAEDRMADKA